MEWNWLLKRFLFAQEVTIWQNPKISLFKGDLSEKIKTIYYIQDIFHNFQHNNRLHRALLLMVCMPVRPSYWGLKDARLGKYYGDW